MIIGHPDLLKPNRICEHGVNLTVKPCDRCSRGIPAGNQVASRPWICPTHGEQWGDTCPYCVQRT